MIKIWTALALLLLTAAPGRAQAPAGVAVPEGCAAPLRAVGQLRKLPLELLETIAMVESGRVDPRTGRAVPWPWTINVEGVGYFFETKQLAIAAVLQWQASGHPSIDVGCMQINLRHHPLAFATLDDAFDPRTNIEYGARFLAGLRQQFGAWPLAIAGYHSQTPDVGAPYWDRVLAGWRLAARYTDGLPLRKPGAPAAAAPLIATNSPEIARRLAEVQQDHRRNVADTRLSTRLAGWPATERLAMNGVR